MLKKGIASGQRLKEIIKSYANTESSIIESPMISVIFSELLQLATESPSKFSSQGTTVPASTDVSITP